jgi:hypothetical protein
MPLLVSWYTSIDPTLFKIFYSENNVGLRTYTYIVYRHHVWLVGWGKVLSKRALV